MTGKTGTISWRMTTWEMDVWEVSISNENEIHKTILLGFRPDGTGSSSRGRHP
jgi:hypothetical protein